MVGVLIAFPEIVRVGLDKPVDTSNATLTDELALPAEDLSMPEPDEGILDAMPADSERAPDSTPKP